MYCVCGFVSTCVCVMLWLAVLYQSAGGMVHLSVNESSATLNTSILTQVASTQLSAVFAFDSYRELKNDLERVHVYSSDNPTGISMLLSVLLRTACTWLWKNISSAHSFIYLSFVIVSQLVLDLLFKSYTDVLNAFHNSTLHSHLCRLQCGASERIQGDRDRRALSPHAEEVRAGRGPYRAASRAEVQIVLCSVVKSGMVLCVEWCGVV